MADGEERRPLLSTSSAGGTDVLPPYSATNDTEEASNIVTVPPIGPDELPPPYTPSPSGGIPMINCKVCQSMINIEGKTHQHVVKCSVCNEATPIKAAPPGKKYVRCPCNCLLICKGMSQRIACPRPNCKKIIQLSVPVEVIPIRAVGMSRIICAHCGNTFLFNLMNRALARCPHCRKISSVGRGFARRKSAWFCSFAWLSIVVAIVVTVTTVSLADSSPSGGMIALCVALFVSAMILLVRGLYYCTMRISDIEGPA